MGFAVAYTPCGWCPYKESGERCGMCELEFRRKEWIIVRKDWISVEERLPDNGEKVLTVDNEGYMIVASWYELGGWFLPVCRANPVTHWMPLPEPPGGE